LPVEIEGFTICDEVYFHRKPVINTFPLHSETAYYVFLFRQIWHLSSKIINNFNSSVR
jgi:hypothetical protein